MNKKGFTLIELLAIIVILAIIAVITVPLILGIIDDAKKNSAKDSAYGFKDAIDKYYIFKIMDDDDLILNGSYTVSSGKIIGPNITNVNGAEIPVSGDKPESGTLEYENNILKSGCLVIGDYAITFNEAGISSTEKGDCPHTIASCPNCIFLYTTTSWAVEGNPMHFEDDIPIEVTPGDYDYTNIVNLVRHPYFNGIIESTTTPGKIGRSFACGIENDTAFCLEGYDTSKWESNIEIINEVFPECGAGVLDSRVECYGTDVNVVAENNGNVLVIDINSNLSGCSADNYGQLYCGF